MKRRLTLALTATALAAAMVPGVASAGAPVGGCPSGAEWRIIEPIHESPADKNGDGLLCRRDLNNELGGALGGGFTFFDNVVQDD